MCDAASNPSSTCASPAGAQDIVAEMAAELPAAREKARGDLRQHGQLVSQLSRAAKQAQQASDRAGGGGVGDGNGFFLRALLMGGSALLEYRDGAGFVCPGAKVWETGRA